MSQKLGPRQLKWVEALESGRYKQTTGHLHNKKKGFYEENYVDAFCCLGVACDLFKSDVDLNVRVDERTSYDSYTEYLYTEQGGQVPDSIMDYLGLWSQEGHFEPETARAPSDFIEDTFLDPNEDKYFENHSSLVDLNDDEGYSFKKIAETIRLQPEKFFKEEK